MADEFDRASDLEQAQRDAALARALATVPVSARPVLCEHCEEYPRVAGSVNFARCDLELGR